ncbi:MAG: hypothetical protein GXY34_00100 [Syntrophomonadaceae bacterium]|nr:hypothetical protein [Syntrophomonadaceae bacterium]
MIEGALNQSAVWKHVTGHNGYGEAIFDDPVTVKVRWEGKRRLVRNKKGEEVVSEAIVYCLEAVQPGDSLEYEDLEWIVINVTEATGFDGTVWHRECSV